MCAEGLLLGARELPFLARVYAGNIAVFLTSLYVISRRSLGLSAVWMGLTAFQAVRLVQFGLRAISVGLVRMRGGGGGSASGSDGCAQVES